jgi:hypothetical protein
LEQHSTHFSPTLKLYPINKIKPLIPIHPPKFPLMTSLLDSGTKHHLQISPGHKESLLPKDSPTFNALDTSGITHMNQTFADSVNEPSIFADENKTTLLTTDRLNKSRNLKSSFYEDLYDEQHRTFRRVGRSFRINRSMTPSRSPQFNNNSV